MDLLNNDDNMSTKNKKLYLTDIAIKMNLTDTKSLLSALLPYNKIFTQQKNVHLKIKIAEPDHFESMAAIPPVTIRLRKDHLEEIIRKGLWAGNVMLVDILLLDDNPYASDGKLCPTYVSTNEGMSFSIDDLFVFEDDFVPLKAQLPDILSQIAATATEIPSSGLSSTTSTGSRKDTIRINATRKACEEVIEEIEQGQHGFQVHDEYKTNWKTFTAAVQVKLGAKPHRDAAREEWEKVDANLKHTGRKPEQ